MLGFVTLRLAPSERTLTPLPQLHTYVLPIMQGYFQIAHFGVPREPEASEEGEFAVVDYVLVSRRSRDRAGLRYQRRGIDDDANAANFVETETIMRVEVRPLIGATADIVPTVVF